ncbi:MAG: hypothetical protein MUO99_06065, partial [Dehalococcoidales bacterium]|nr:hypothetical protein [Dehalococcoidales bacterium]
FLAVAAAAVAIGTAISVIVVKSINFADELVDIADAVGMTTDEVQKLAFALKFEGIQAGTITSIMRFMSNAMQVAADSQAAATEETIAFTDAFTKLGIDLKRFSTLDTAEQIDVLFRALANVSDENERARLTTDLLGRSGMELLPVIQDWVKNQDRLNQLLKDFGIPEDALRDMASMKDDMETFKIALEYIGLSITQSLMPAIKVIMPYLPEFAKKFSELTTPENIENLKALAETFIKMGEGVLWVIEKLIELNAAIGGILHPDWAPLIPNLIQKKGRFAPKTVEGIPQLASGGIAMSPMLARIGEIPEAIIPLSQMSRGGEGGVGGGGVTVIIQGDFLGDEMSLRNLERRLENVRRQEGNRSLFKPSKTEYYSQGKHL